MTAKYQKELVRQAKRNQATQQAMQDYLKWKRDQHITWSQIY